MRKPSIFSSEYQKKMRRRKKKATIAIVTIIIVFVIVMIASKTNLSGIGKALGNITKGSSSASANTTKQPMKPKVVAKQGKTAKKKAAIIKKVDTENFVVTMPSGKQVKVIYDSTKSSKTIKSVENSDSDLDYNINPSSSSVIVFQKSTQDVMLGNSDGTSQNITNVSYVSGSGQSFTKDATLKNNPAYIWVQSPKFIDDSNIAYVTQLPWFNKNDKYIWKYNVKDKSNINTNITGSDVKINNITANGLEIVTDTKTQYLKGDGSLGN